MQAGLISIGDELLMGTTVNTNAAWLSEQLYKLGMSVGKVVTVQDKKEDIQRELDELSNAMDLVICTGGLGPTKDDVTKLAFCEFLDTTLEENERVLQAIQSRFDTPANQLSSVLRQQAQIPRGVEPLLNKEGVAPGLWWEQTDKAVVVVLPGVPSEMKQLFREEVVPNIKRRFSTPSLMHKHLHTIGISESALSDKLEAVQEKLPEEVQLAFLPKLGQVTLRISVEEDRKAQAVQQLKKIKETLYDKVGDYIYGEGTTTVEAKIGEMLREQQATVATAESCTGGYIAHRFTRTPGSSDYFKGSVVAYSNFVKQRVLGVEERELQQYGAVSEPVVKAMVRGVKQTVESDYAITTSGIAGPGGGTSEKPVGTVWIGWATPDAVKARRFHFKRGRLQNIHLTHMAGIYLLRQELLD